MASADEIVQAAARVVVNAALRALDGDIHEYGTRGCETCRFVTQIAGWDFGCVRRYKEVQARAAARRAKESQHE